MHNIYQKLKEVWGYDTFRPRQEEIIQSIIDNVETIGLLPTGGGKSLCFQLPILVKPGYSVVVSPLIALIEDQVRSLKEKNVKVEGINYQMSPFEIEEVYRKCILGEIKILYVSPERLRTDSFKKLIHNNAPQMIVVDEAHCISQWGHDFRPAYLNIRDVKEYLPLVPIHAFTATADKRVLSDIKTYLGMRHSHIFRKSFVRKNLSFRIEYAENKQASMLHFLKEFSGSGIIYVRSRRGTEEVSSWLNRNGFSAGFYHAGLPVDQRTKVQNDWMQSDDQVMVSTNAFGMGVDKANVRFVIHLDLPEDLESYYQEAGRAGRDGLDSMAMVLYNHRDIRQLDEKSKLGFPEIKLLKSCLRLLYSMTEKGSDHIIIDNTILERFEDKGMDAKSLKTVLKILMQYGIIKYDENEHIFSMFRLNENQITDLKHESSDHILKAIHQFYGNGKGWQKFDEEMVGAYIGIPKKELEILLHEFAANKLLEYKPGTKALKVIFLKPDNLGKSLKEYNNYRKVKLRKVNHMMDFIRLAMCRQLYILRYFGELSTKKCKKCDICTSKDRMHYTQADYSAFKQKLQTMLKGKAVEVDELKLEFPFFEKEKHLAMLQEMYYEGELSIKGKRLHFLI